MEVLRAHENLSADRLGNVGKACGCHQGIEVPVLLQAHMREIGGRADAAEFVVFIHHKQGAALHSKHFVPCMMDGFGARNDHRFVDVDIRDGRAGIRQKQRVFLMKPLENELGLLIQRSLPAGNGLLAAAPQKIGIGNRRADTVGIGVPVSGHINCLVHSISSNY